MLKFKLKHLNRLNYSFSRSDGERFKLEKVKSGGTLQQLQGM